MEVPPRDSDCVLGYQNRVLAISATIPLLSEISVGLNASPPAIRQRTVVPFNCGRSRYLYRWPIIKVAIPRDCTFWSILYKFILEYPPKPS